MAQSTGLKIGKYEINGAALAPMAGYTDIAFRELCKSFGAGLTVTEMVSVRGLLHDSKKTELLMRTSPLETPSCVQLFGSDPDDFSRAAEIVHSDIIDVNMGCPMPKITKNGDGSALLKAPELAGKIVRALVNATDKPITVKTRLGYRNGDEQAEALIESVTEAGAAAVTVHGRYAEQRYGGQSDTEKLEKLCEKCRIPFIANGDMTQVKPPFDAVMIGRYALKNPAVFCGGAVNPVDIATKHLDLLTKYFDERYAVIQMRKFAAHYFANIRGGREVRAAIYSSTTVDEVYRVLGGAFIA